MPRINHEKDILRTHRGSSFVFFMMSPPFNNLFQVPLFLIAKLPLQRHIQNKCTTPPRPYKHRCRSFIRVSPGTCRYPMKRSIPLWKPCLTAIQPITVLLWQILHIQVLEETHLRIFTKLPLVHLSSCLCPCLLPSWRTVFFFSFYASTH